MKVVMSIQVYTCQKQHYINEPAQLRSSIDRVTQEVRSVMEEENDEVEEINSHVKPQKDQEKIAKSQNKGKAK